MNTNDPFSMNANIIEHNFKAVAKTALIANIVAVIVFFGGLAGIIYLISYLIKH